MMNTTTKPRNRGKRKFILSGWLLLAVVVIAGIVYGPELYGLLRVGMQVKQIAADDTRAGGTWPRPSEACIGCHGYGGNAGSQIYPHLAGQPEAYLKKQLVAFASGERSDPNMTPMAVSMSPHELDSLVTIFSKTAPLPNATFQADPARVARGEVLLKASNCAACHGQQLEGKDLYPRLAGQGHDYLVDQLTRFKSGARRDASGAMPAVVSALSQQDIEDLAQFIASR
ncbi:c-type cytochrome [Paraburkholderia bryophila]|uniref:c-type cytochrome n=1 Tax=Paraburkholderia bryophila TaxID=420952 RepID=UPI00234A8940|nr:c-type cytochrome [Paraburkholderia bryophila]WCM24919.1 c-type cytochrome [Paraburkholderia bryophila]